MRTSKIYIYIKRERERERDGGREGERFIIRNWLMQLWRLTSSKIWVLYTQDSQCIVSNPKA